MPTEGLTKGPLIPLRRVRDAVDLTQIDMAVFFGFKGPNGRNTVARWENGTGNPPAMKHRTRFISYLGIKLGLWNDRERFDEVWNDLKDRWRWPAITEREWLDYAMPTAQPSAIHDRQNMAVGNQERERLVKLGEIALTELLALQYPWGEWSDEMTRQILEPLERPLRGPQGPKPNVAITIFAVEVLRHFGSDIIQQYKNLGMNWLLTNIHNGWAQDWSEGQTADLSSQIPVLEPRDDVRHTAEVACALLRFGTKRDPLAQLLENVVNCYRSENGYWPEMPGATNKRLLASIFAVEALGYAFSGSFRIALKDMLEGGIVKKARSAFKGGLNAIHTEADLGNGLLGKSFGGTTPYWTGIALLRFAPLVKFHPDIRELVEKLIHGLLTCMDDDGWTDHLAEPTFRPNTRKTTTLRIVAGLSSAARGGISISQDIAQKAANLALRFILDEKFTSELDSLDFAFTLIWLFSIYEYKPSSGELVSIESNAMRRASEHRQRWVTSFKQYRDDLQPGKERGVLGYQELADIFEEKLRLLNT